MSGLHKFLICVLSVVVAVSLGVTVYYFARNNGETISLSSYTCYENLNDTFIVSIKQEKADKNTTLELKSSNNEIVELVSKDGLAYTFKAKSAGTAYINLFTSNTKFEKLSCEVSVADGSTDYPYYVRDINDLKKIKDVADGGYGLDKNYRQINNIDLNGQTYTPIAPTSDKPFVGTYDGKNKQISNLSITADTNYAGMFGFVGQYAKLHNIVLKNENIKTNANMIGGIAAQNMGGEIADCAVEAKLENTNAAGFVGGIVAQNRVLAKVMTSSFVGTLANGLKLGGIAADNINARIQDCYARGSFKPASTSQMGGVVCYNQSSSGYRANIINTYSTMSNEITSNANVGMIVFLNQNNDGTTALSESVTTANRVYGNHYATTQGYTGINGVADNASYTAKILTPSVKSTYGTFASNGEVATWNFDQIWDLNANTNNGYPTLRANAKTYAADADVFVPSVTPSHSSEIIEVDTSVITTPAQLTSLMNETAPYSLDKSYTLGADIDMTGVDWTAKTLNGSLDGDGHTISNLNVVATTSDAAGMFARLNGTIKNLNLTNLKINTTASYIGTVAGENYGTIEDVTVNGEYLVAQNNDASRSVGGIAGTNTNLIKNVNATISYALKNPTYVGGIAGSNTGKVENATYNGQLVAQEAYALGGLVGQNSNIVQYSKANVAKFAVSNTNSNSYVGGVAGITENLLQGCIAEVSGTDIASGRFVGGIAGKAYGTINACGINNAKLTGQNVAGLVSQLEGGYVANSYTYTTLDGTTVAGMANTFSNNAKVEKSYIATSFVDEDASGKDVKYESNSTFRLNGNLGSVENNVLNRDVMGAPAWKDSKRQYAGNYASQWLFGLKKEWNLPNDNLCSNGDCNGTDVFNNRGWDAGIWNYGEGGPKLKSIAELQA